jgi:hypothetical protein
VGPALGQRARQVAERAVEALGGVGGQGRGPPARGPPSRPASAAGDPSPSARGRSCGWPHPGPALPAPPARRRVLGVAPPGWGPPSRSGAGPGGLRAAARLVRRSPGGAP